MKIKKYQIPSGPLPSYLFDVTRYKAPEKYTDTIEPAVITATLPEKFHGSQAAAARYAAAQKWGQENVAKPRDQFAQEYILPTMGAAAFGLPGLTGLAGGFLVDGGINIATNGNKNSFGDLFVDPKKYPILNTAVNFFNPGYYLGGLAVTKPLVQTVSPRTAVTLGLEKEYLKNEIKALNRNIKNWKGNDVIKKNILAGKIGWAPKQSITLWHNSETPISKLETTFPSWDVTTHDAPLGHVWGTSTETRQGFIGARPYHNRTSKPIVLEKPMVQLNEAVGNGKNAVRNEILKFADQSGADAINFRNIKDNTLSNQDVYAVFKDVNVVPKLSEAERLGIPKHERKAFDWSQIQDLIPRFNKWAEYYGYETIPKSTNITDAVDIMKQTFNRHNTFFRAIHTPTFKKDISNLQRKFKIESWKELFPYFATTGREDYPMVNITPNIDKALKYIDDGKIAIVRRKYKLGYNPKNWLNDSDFNIIHWEYSDYSPLEISDKAAKQNSYIYQFRKNFVGKPNELLAPNGTLNFIKYASDQPGQISSLIKYGEVRPEFKQGGILKKLK